MERNTTEETVIFPAKIWALGFSCSTLLQTVFLFFLLVLLGLSFFFSPQFSLTADVFMVQTIRGVNPSGMLWTEAVSTPTDPFVHISVTAECPGRSLRFPRPRGWFTLLQNILLQNILLLMWTEKCWKDCGLCSPQVWFNVRYLATDQKKYWDL